MVAAKRQGVCKQLAWTVAPNQLFALHDTFLPPNPLQLNFFQQPGGAFAQIAFDKTTFA